MSVGTRVGTTWEQIASLRGVSCHVTSKSAEREDGARRLGATVRERVEARRVCQGAARAPARRSWRRPRGAADTSAGPPGDGVSRCSPTTPAGCWRSTSTAEPGARTWAPCVMPAASSASFQRSSARGRVRGRTSGSSSTSRCPAPLARRCGLLVLTDATARCPTSAWPHTTACPEPGTPCRRAASGT